MTDAQLRFWRAGICVVIVATLIALGVGWRSCDRQGGQYVRGLVWMECIR